MSFQAMTWATEQRLPAMQKIVLLMMANRTNHETGECHPSLDLLAKECGMEKRSVINQISKLEALGLVSVSRIKRENGMNCVNKYWLNLSKGSERDSLGSERDSLGSERDSLGGSERDSPKPVTLEPVIEPIKTLLRKNAKTPASETENGFDKFWAIYPKRKSKEDAFKAWNKLNPDEQLQQTIIDAVVLAKTQDFDWAKDGGKFIPYPATYLNGKRWQDEIDMRTQKSPGDRTSQNQGISKHNGGNNTARTNGYANKQQRLGNLEAELFGGIAGFNAYQAGTGTGRHALCSNGGDLPTALDGEFYISGDDQNGQV
jgi:hypothetical protein